MVVLSDINRPLSGCLYPIRVHIGIKSLSQEHEGTLTQTELAIIVQIPLLGVSVLPNFGAVTADRALRSRLFRVTVGLRAQLQLSTSFQHLTEKNSTKIGAFELSDHHNGHIRGRGRFKFWRSNGR